MYMIYVCATHLYVHVCTRTIEQAEKYTLRNIR